MKNTILHLSLLAIFIVVFDAKVAFAQTVLLYQNSFETPLIPPVTTCSPDLDNNPVNTLWGGTGLGIGGGGDFLQLNTVETILINGANLQYNDPSGLGGNYCIGMLDNFQNQNDKLALTLNAQMLPFLNMTFLLSPIDVPGCGGPFGVDTAEMYLRVYDTPGGIFSFASPGTILDEDTVVSGSPGLTPDTFNWSICATSLDISNSLDSSITIVFDLIRSGYAAIDSVKISSSVTTSIQNLNQYNNVTVFPNPSKGEINISMREFRNEKTILKLTDLYGRKINEFEIISENTSLKLEQPNGIYFATISTDTKIYTKKIIIER
jgi:hypothetical protein